MADDFNLNYEILTFKNVDEQPFEVVYNKRSYGVLSPGQVQQMPGFLARHAEKHLIDQILNRLNIRTNNDVEREKWAKQIIIHQQVMQAQPAKSQDERLAEEVQKLNTVSTVDTVLSQAKAENPTLEQPVADDVPSTPAGTPATPTRDQLLQYARGKLGMVLDDKTLETFNKMSDSELAVELNYEV